MPISHDFGRCLKPQVAWHPSPQYTPAALILGFLHLLFPHFKSINGLLGQQQLHIFAAFARFKCYFMVDEIIVETDVGGIFTVIGIVNVIQSRPINSTKTHFLRSRQWPCASVRCYSFLFLLYNLKVIVVMNEASTHRAQVSRFELAVDEQAFMFVHVMR